VGKQNQMVVKLKTYTKNCPQCGNLQTYGRKGHLDDAIRGQWKCKSCSNHDNNFAGKHHFIPHTWFNMKKKAGISRGYAWDLTIENIWDLYEKQDSVCALSGLPIGWSSKGLTATASIDRIDSSEGYILENVQLVHKDINFMKQQFDQEYFINLCKEVANKVKW
jgi:ribosomal protein L37AE/L43A